MENRKLENFIIGFFKKYSNNHEYISLYQDFQDSKVQSLFSTLHSNLVFCFEELNHRIERGSDHFLADSSRFFLSLIDSIDELCKNESSLFDIDTKYKNAIQECKKFLCYTHGSNIPPEMKQVELYYSLPIFIPKLNIKSSNGREKYTLKMIGEGSYAKVYKYEDTHYQKTFAVKQAKKNLTKDELERFKREFENMKSFSCPYILEVFSYNEEKNEYIMEYIEETLENYINKSNQKLKNQERKSIGIQIIKGFKYILSKKMFHRDISPNNILVKKYDGIINIKISDFGLVKIPDSNLTNKETKPKGSFNDESDLGKIGFSNYSLPHEIFAISKVLFFVATGKKQAEGIKCKFLEKGTHGDKKQRYINLDDLQQDFIDFLKERDNVKK